jgi:hypothetical protein
LRVSIDHRPRTSISGVHIHAGPLVIITVVEKTLLPGIVAKTISELFLKLIQAAPRLIHSEDAS